MPFDDRFSPEELRRILQERLGSGVRINLGAQPQRDGEETDEAESRRRKREEVLRFDFKPSDIKKYLDRFVIRQDDAKKVLATAICDHYHHIQRTQRGTDEWFEYKKQNIILIGPTGVGKTYLVQNIARLIGVPFVKADATKFSETGYVGGDVEDLVRELVAQAGGDIELAECGIIYLDEIDKLASPTQTVGRDVSGRGVQRTLLKLMEETEVPLRSPTDIAGQMQALMEFQTKGRIEKKTINTQHILFIVSGAFSGLTEIIKRRIGSKQIGFTGDKPGAEEEHKLFEKVRAVDFIEYGFEAEFAGRLPVVVHCEALTVDDLFDILKYSEGSILKQYRADFKAYGIDVYFTDDGMRAIARLAAEEQTGARGLMSVCEKVFRDFKYCLPDSPVRGFVVTEELVRDPQGKLRELLENPGMFSERILRWKLDGLAREIREEHGVEVGFTDEAVQTLAREAAELGKDAYEYAREKFQGFEPALRLLGKAAGSSHFRLQPDDVGDLGSTFERWIRESYR
ncbi:MAG TPA: AAA family ATPase [Acidobacteriota bacterium]|jgi:endopeptidase Clp ATP-binding regulatory subunit ClpX|nr:AAA family ATPase [Acidobacteriota bacterium]